MQIDLLKHNHSSIIDEAGPEDFHGAAARPFVCNYAVNFVSNDSPSFDLRVNFDSPAGRAGTILLKAGEAMSDLQITCREIYAQGVGGFVPFRAVGA